MDFFTVKNSLRQSSAREVPAFVGTTEIENTFWFYMIFWYGRLFFCPPSFWTMEMILAFLTNCWGYLHFGYLDLGFPTFQDFSAFASEVINFIVAFAETYGEIEAMCGKKPQKKKKHPMPSKMISITITAHYFRKRTTAFYTSASIWQKLPPSWHHLVLSNASWTSVLHLSFAGVSSQHLKTHAPLIVAVAAVSWFGCPSHLKSKVTIKSVGLCRKTLISY